MTGASESAATGAPRYIDLHMHSTASDGALSPTSVVEEAARVGLPVIALTDHDTLAGIEEARAAGAPLGVRVVAGVELSAVEEEREVHLLGLHLERFDAIDRPLASFRATRVDRARHIVEKLHALGVPVSLHAVLAEAGDGAVGRPHVARALVAGGFVRDLREAFDRWLGDGRPAYAPKERLTLEQGVALIHAAGGLAVLAHPGAEATRPRLEALRAVGLDGVEVLHPSHGAEETRRIGALAQELDLVPSGGSDWHGANSGARTLGSMHVPGAWLAQQEARLRAREGREQVA